MNATRLIEYYDRIADAPDAVEKLRQLIHGLAVRGMLVPQDPRDEPAAELIERLLQDVVGDSCQSLRGWVTKNASQRRNFPTNWMRVPLLLLGKWAIGTAFPKAEQGIPQGPYFFLKVSDMNLPGNEKFIVTANNCIDDNAAERMNARIHPVNTIIFPKIGGAIATNKRRILTKPSAIDNNCLGIIFSSAVNLEWAYLLLTTFDFTKYQVGTAIPALQQFTLGKIEVLLPPRAEQHRIVAKVDELVAICDRIESQRAQRETTRDRFGSATLACLNAADPEPGMFADHARFAIQSIQVLTTRADQIRPLRETILNLAVRGKLVPQDANDEPASNLLKRIAAERSRLLNEGRVKSTRRETLHSGFDSEDNTDLPPLWALTRLGSVYDVRDGTHDTPRYVESGFPLVTSKHLSSGFLSLRDVKFISEADHIAISGRSKVDKGDVLLAMIGTIGNPAIVEIDTPFSIKNVALFKYFGRETSCPAFLRYFLQHAASQMKNLAAGGLQPFVSLGFLRTYPIVLPPLPEQRRIAAKVDELFALCDPLERTLSARDERQHQLLNALIAEARAAAVNSSDIVEGW